MRARRCARWLSVRSHVAGPDISTVTAFATLAFSAILPRRPEREAAAIKQSASETAGFFLRLVRQAGFYQLLSFLLLKLSTLMLFFECL